MLNKHLNTFLVGNHLKLLSQKPVPKGFLWEVEKLRSEQACLRCGSIKTVRAGKCTSIVREEPMQQMSLWLKIHKHKYYCKDCKSTFAEPVPGIWPRSRSIELKVLAGRIARLLSLQSPLCSRSKSPRPYSCNINSDNS